jgi:hypothetical protein
MPEEPGAAYERGVTAGAIDARLANHDKHFAAINGSVADLVREVHGMNLAHVKELQALTLAVQQLRDQAVADARTRVTTAEAVEKSREETAKAVESERVVRRDSSERTWAPWAKALAVIGGVAAVVAIIAAAVGIYLARK